MAAGRLCLRIGVAAVAAAVPVALAGCGSSGPARGASSPVARLDVKLQPSPALRRAAPQFALRDSEGRLVRLSQFRGKAVILTFIYDHCPDVCPLIVGNLHAALARLGTQASRVQFVAVSVDPRGDTPATVRPFLAAHEMTGHMEYLIGTQRELAPVWRAYGIAVAGSPDSREVSHSSDIVSAVFREQ